MTDSRTEDRESVSERVRELVEALQGAPAITKFRAAEENFRTDAELGLLQTRLRRAHEQIQTAEREGRHDPQLFQEMREGQALLQRHPLALAFVRTRQEAMDLLRQVNGAMTRVLGVDIGGTVGRTGGGC